LLTDVVSPVSSARPTPPPPTPPIRPGGLPVSAQRSSAAKLVLRLGGYPAACGSVATWEFFHRARHVAHIANIPETCYLRRKHPGSLTQRPDTGMDSPARKELGAALKARTLENFAAVGTREAPNLSPFAVAEPIVLKHLCGPQLRENHQPAQLTVPSRKSPVFIVGMHRSGTSLTRTCCGNAASGLARK